MDILEKLKQEKNQKQLNKLELIENLVQQKTSFYLYGSAGTGKTEAILKIAEKQGLTVKSQSVTPLSTKGEFMGFMSVDGKRYVQTPFREAYEKGYVFLLDEMDNISQSLAVSLNQSLSQSVLTFPDTTVKKHKDFLFVGTGNSCNGSTSEFSSRQKMDASYKDRFLFVEWEFNPELELQLSKNENYTLLIQAIRKACTEYKIQIQVSMRSSISGSKMYSENKYSLLDILEISLFKYSLSEDTKNKILTTSYVTEAIEKLLSDDKPEKPEIIEESFNSVQEKEVIVKEKTEYFFFITSPTNIEKYRSLGEYNLCTLDNSPLCKANNLNHFSGDITQDLLDTYSNKKFVFFTHTQEKKEKIKSQLKNLGY